MSTIHYSLTSSFSITRIYLLTDSLLMIQLTQSNKLRLHPLERSVCIGWEVVLTGVSRWATIVHIDTLVLEGTSSVEKIGCFRWLHSLWMVKERFGCWKIGVTLSTHSGGADVKVRLDELLLALSGNRETWLVLLGRGLLEVVLVQSLVVHSRIMLLLSTALVPDLKMIGLQVLHKLSRGLNLLSHWRVNKLLSCWGCLLELIVRTA